MKARALVCTAEQRFSLEEVSLPPLSVDCMVVRALCSGVSIGTEFALIRNKISWGPYPIVTGYQAVGVVEIAGSGVEGFRTGDRVYYRDNKALRLADGTMTSPVAGAHASMAVIDPKKTHGVALLPDGVGVEAASLFVMPAVGLAGVNMAGPGLGDFVVVFGVGLIGLGVVAACVHRGCVVVAMDRDEERLAVARRLGAEITVDTSKVAADEALRRIRPHGADCVFECTGIPECVEPTMALCAAEGSFVWQGNYGEAAFPFHFLPAHGRRLRMFFPCDDGLAPSRRAVMRNMATGALPWDAVITHRVTPEAAPALYQSINDGRAEGVVGAVIRWSE